jgi:hypothetical protein
LGWTYNFSSDRVTGYWKNANGTRESTSRGDLSELEYISYVDYGEPDRSDDIRVFKGSIDLNSFEYAEEECTSDWYCSLYGDCQTDDKRYCIEAIDNNSCGQEFSGNLTADFTPQTCDYCTPSWSCSSIQSDCPVNKVKECYAVADANDCYAQTALSSDQFNGSLITYNSECGYVAGYTTANLRDETVDIGANSMLEVIALMAVLVAIVVAGVVDARIKRLKWW